MRKRAIGRWVWIGSTAARAAKIDNCIISVHTAYARNDQHCLLDGELFLPESWDPLAPDPSIERKRLRAKLPHEVVHRPKTVIALEQIKRALAQWGGRALRHNR